MNYLTYTSMGVVWDDMAILVLSGKDFSEKDGRFGCEEIPLNSSCPCPPLRDGKLVFVRKPSYRGAFSDKTGQVSSWNTSNYRTPKTINGYASVVQLALCAKRTTA